MRGPSVVSWSRGWIDWTQSYCLLVFVSWTLSVYVSPRLMDGVSRQSAADAVFDSAAAMKGARHTLAKSAPLFPKTDRRTETE